MQFDRFIATCYKKLSCGNVDKELVQRTDTPNLFKVKSASLSTKWYLVDMTLGVRECPVGCTGQPCKHQAAVVLQFGTPCHSYITSLNAFGRQEYANIALGKDSNDLSFYASLHQNAEEKAMDARCKQENERGCLQNVSDNYENEKPACSTTNDVEEQIWIPCTNHPPTKL